MHPYEHAKSSARKYGGTPDEYMKYHQWLDETKAWLPNSLHRLFRHHSEGIFEMERLFGDKFVNSELKIVYVRYIGEDHVREDCDGYIPTAREWAETLMSGKKAKWMIKTLKIETKGNVKD